MAEERYQRVPVTVLTGFLGAGKTTLLNHILTADHGHKIAVIINEFGEIGIDNQLVVGADEEVLEMNNGCICCEVRGDLVRILRDLFKSKQGETDRQLDFDAVVIETTGLANPGPVIQTFFMDDLVNAFYKLDAIVTVVDAKHAPLHLDDGHEAQEQIAFADVMLLNKTDLVTHEELKKLESRLLSMNPKAKLYPTQNSVIDIGLILDIHSFELDDVLKIHPRVLEEDHHHHDDHVQSIILRSEQPLQLPKMEAFINEWLSQRAADTFRYKGIIYAKGLEQRIVFQGVHEIFLYNADRYWQPNEPKRTDIVIIGRNLDENWFRDRFQQCIQES